MLDTGAEFSGLYVFHANTVIGPSKEGYVWVINDAKDKMYVPEGTIMGMGQDWEEEQEIVDRWVP